MARATKPTSSKAKEVEESVSTQMNELLTAKSTANPIAESTAKSVEDTAVNIETPKESVEVKETPSSTGSFDMAQFAQMFQQMQNQMQEQINKLQEQLVSTTEKLNEKIEKNESASGKQNFSSTNVNTYDDSVSTPISNLGPVVDNTPFGQTFVYDGTMPSMTLPNNTVYAQPTTQPMSKSDYYLEILANRKSDREVTIVHNREMIGGLSTHIVLTGLKIDFHTLGEERVLSWQQFEECVSKYRKFFEKEIILLASDYEDVAKRYSVPCVKRGNNNVLSRDNLREMGYMDVHKLEKFYLSLTEEDKAFMCSYWLGKCYEKDPNFYDRYKIETLNRLSDAHIFDNLLVGMNNDFLRENQAQSQNQQNKDVVRTMSAN